MTAEAKFSMSNLFLYFRAFKPSFALCVFSTHSEVLCIPLFFFRGKMEAPIGNLVRELRLEPFF